MSEAAIAPGESRMAQAFGATVQVGRSDPGLCLVVSRSGDPGVLVARAGGRLVTRLPGANRVLALLSWEALSALRASPAIATAGAVTIDPQRFAQFCRLAGIDGDEEPPNGVHRTRQE